MVKQYLLDTNTVIDMLKARSGIQRQVISHGPGNCFISDITISELLTGYYLSGNEKEKMDIDFLKENFVLLRMTPSALDVFARKRVLLKKQGTPVPALDLMIMSTAIAGNLIAVSHDSHFSLLEDLKHEDWVME